MKKISNANKVKAYYGSTVDFNQWDITKTREFGYHFGIEDAEQSLHRIRNKGHLYEVILTFSNPIKMKDAMRWDLTAIANGLGIPKEEISKIENEARVNARKNFSNLSVEKNLIAEKILNQSGYDAILYDNEGESGGKAIIIWNPNQIQVINHIPITGENDFEGKKKSSLNLRYLKIIRLFKSSSNFEHKSI